MDKIKVNNQVVSMRKYVKQAKIRVMNKYAKEIKLLQNKKGNEKQMLKYKRKAERLLEKMTLFKKIHPDSVSKLALSKAKNWKEILQQKTTLLPDQCFALLANYSTVQAEVEKFHSENKELIPKIPSLILEWEVKAKNPNSRNKNNRKSNNADMSKREERGQKFISSHLENGDKVDRRKKCKSKKSEKGHEENKRKAMKNGVKSEKDHSVNNESRKKELFVSVKEGMSHSEKEEMSDSEKEEMSVSEKEEMSDSEKEDVSHSEEEDMSHSKVENMSDFKREEMSHSKNKKMSDSKKEDLSDSEKEEMSDSENEEASHSEKEEMSDSENKEMSHFKTEQVSNSDRNELNSYFKVLGSKSNFKTSKPHNKNLTSFKPDINSRLLKLSETSAENRPSASPEPALSHKTDPFFITGESVVEDERSSKKVVFKERRFDRRNPQYGKFDFKDSNKSFKSGPSKFGAKNRKNLQKSENMKKPFKKNQAFKNDFNSSNHFNKNKNNQTNHFQKGAKTPIANVDEPLHPSWQAKRKLKEAVKTGFAGKRVVFND